MKGTVTESVRRYDRARCYSDRREADPAQAWSVHELWDTCLRSVTSALATPEDLQSPRSCQERSSVTSSQVNMHAAVQKLHCLLEK